VRRQPRRGLDPVDLIGLGLIGVAAAVTGHLLRPLELYDDAGISFRYAQRFADGDGLTWNDHERVMGFSNPLYTLVLAIARWLGLPMIGTARALGLLAFVAAVLLVAVLAHRFAGRAAAVGAAAVLIVAEPFRAQVLSGMEVGWSVVFGLGAVLAATSRRQGLAGVLLGLALLNKLDAALLAVPLGLMWWAVHRSWPWRMAGAAAAVLAPWLLVATAWYGSPVPNSVVFKLGDETRPFTRLWVLRSLAADGNRMLLLAVPAAAGLPVWWRTSDGGRKLAAGALAGWFLLQALALSFIDLGADYPWYLTVLYPPLAILGVAGLVRGISSLARRSGLWDDRRPLPTAAQGHLVLLAAALVGAGALVGDRRPPPGLAAIVLVTAAAVVTSLLWRSGRAGRRVGVALLIVVLAASAIGAGAVASDGAQRLAHRDEPTADELWEIDRREAGRQIGLLAAPDEAIATCFGWVGYEAIDRVVSDVCGLNQEDDPEEPVAWVVDHGRPNDAGAAEPVAPPGFRAAANITGTCQRYPEWSWFTLWVLEGTDADRRAPEISQVPEECGTP
jgi:hypothetical protein